MKKFLKENWFLIFAIAYLIMPIDLIPDVPFIGTLDDAGVLFIELVRRMSGKNKTPINDVEKKILEK